METTCKPHEKRSVFRNVLLFESAVQATYALRLHKQNSSKTFFTVF